jgi:hypothetical protein
MDPVLLAWIDGLRLSLPVTVNAGAWPATVLSARLRSPSWAKALLRIASIRELRFWREAIVESHA